MAVESLVKDGDIKAGIQVSKEKKKGINAQLQDIMKWLGTSKMDYFFIVPRNIADKYTAPVPFVITPTEKQAAVLKKAKGGEEHSNSDAAALKQFNSDQARLTAALSDAVVQWVIALE